MLISLSALPLNQRAVIKNIRTDNVTEERLHSFGLYEDTVITPVVNAPLGSPRVYRCLNTLVAIRNQEAGLIDVQIGDMEK